MNIAIIGAGTMGSGIAQVSAVSGHSVTLIDSQAEALERAKLGISQSLNKLASKGKLSQEASDNALSNIRTSQSLDDLQASELVVEAVFEDMAVKRKVWQEIDRQAPSECLLASNTSSLSVTEIASLLRQPERFFGLHFFNPVPLMPLVEVIRALQSGEDAIAAGKGFVEGLGKSPIVCEDRPGFIVNRLLVPYMNDAIHALSEGVASAEDIDKAMKLGANMPIGPLALADLVGLAVELAAIESLYNEFGDSKSRPAPLLRQMVRAGKLGRKSKEGFYSYE